MASGFPVRELGFGVQIPMPTRAEAGTGGLLKRSLTEMERQQRQQMQMQHAHFLRSVRQRTLLAPHASSYLPPPLLPVLSSGSSSSSVSSNLTASGLARPQEHSSVPQAAATGVERMRDRLQELERRLLLDEEEEEEEGEVSASSSAVTTVEWSDAMQQIITPQAPVPTPLSSSPTSSSSSTVSSSVSCSPPSTSTATAAAASSSRQMLLDTAAAIADGNLETATAKLAVLNRVANSRGDAEQRLTAMMVGTLLSRLNPAQAGSSSLPIAGLCSGEHFAAAQMLYELSPCFKLGLVAANSAILEATKDHSMIHILDFSLGQGGQYAALLHVLAERHRLQPAVCPPALRITVVADPSSPFTNPNSSGNLRAVGDRIEKLAKRAGLEVRFSVVHRRAAELDASTLGCQPGEVLAVNLAFVLSRVPDESVSPANPRDELLRRVRALQPRVVALVEQDINTSTAAFAGRFAEACAHYGALLESLDATVNRDSSERARVEAGLARQAVNSVAREGMERVERCEVFGKWRARMRMAGFESVPLGPDVIEPVKARLASVAPDHGFTIREEAGGHGLGFGWKGRVITVASAWR